VVTPRLRARFFYLLAEISCILKNGFMKALQKKYLLILFFSLVLVFALDFLTKRWVITEHFEPITFIKGFFYLTGFQRNDGIAFGIALPLWVQIVGSIVIIYLLLGMASETLFKKKGAEFQMALLGAVIGGGIGNLVDRAMHGFVVDFIVLKPFPVFNIADVGITVGLVLLFATILMDQRNAKNLKIKK
jgi:signal peptidase II